MEALVNGARERVEEVEKEKREELADLREKLEVRGR